MPPRTLILANPRAGTLRVMEFFSRFWQRLAHPFPIRRQESDDGNASEIENPTRKYQTSKIENLPLSLTVLAQAAAEAGLLADVETVPPPDKLAERLTAAAQAGYEIVVAVGGDGTVRSVANGLIQSQAPLTLGIVPLGTANNIARALHLPTNLDDALRTIATGTVQPMDAGKIGSEYFLEAAGVGLFADAVAAFGPNEPHRHEIIRIARITLPLIWNPTSRRLRLTLDGVEQTDDVLLAAFSNTPYLAEGFSFAPEASIQDGLFEVVLVASLTRRELVTFGLALLRGKHLELPFVRHTRARSVAVRRVSSRLRPLPVHADDHIAGHTPIEIETVPAALRVLVPAPNRVD